MSMISACGVICGSCPAFHGREKGIEHQRATAAAWKRIFELDAKPETLSCGGCQGPAEELLIYCQTCEAQRCCRDLEFRSCAECPVKSCGRLRKAQAVWDGLAELEKTLSHEDFVMYVQPYCGHRERLQRARERASKISQDERL